MMKKTNNKGFSLVELIVVVLIMAIIAVALAPQVMKWVGNSKKATDVQSYDQMVESCQIAIAQDNLQAKDFTVTITTTGSSVTSESGTSGEVATALGKVNSSWTSTISKEGTSYTITFTAGVYSGGTKPDGAMQ